MKIDSHQHFWKFDPVRDRWIDETMAVIQRDFLPEDLIAEANPALFTLRFGQIVRGECPSRSTSELLASGPTLVQPFRLS